MKSPVLGWAIVVVATLFIGLAGARAQENKPDAAEIPAHGRSPETNGNTPFPPGINQTLMVARPGLGLGEEKEPAAATIPPATDSARSASLFSPHAAALLAASRLKYDPPKTFTELANTTAENGQPGVDVLHLPRLLVRGPRLPRPSEVLSTDGMMEQYLGPKGGFDRGLLNIYTLYWGSGFIRVTLFDAVKNESRARDLFAAEERKRMNTRLRNILSWEKLPVGDTPELNREIKKQLSAQKTLPGK